MTAVYVTGLKTCLTKQLRNFIITDGYFENDYKRIVIHHVYRSKDIFNGNGRNKRYMIPSYYISFRIYIYKIANKSSFVEFEDRGHKLLFIKASVVQNFLP